MRWREILFGNLWWKLLAFALAIMIWSGAQNAEIRPITPPTLPNLERTLHDIPIRVLTHPGTVGPFLLDPPTAQLDVEGDPLVVRRLGASEPLVFVDIASDPGTASLTNRIDVRLPNGVTLVNVLPEYVVIRRQVEE